MRLLREITKRGIVRKKLSRILQETPRNRMKIDPTPSKPLVLIFKS